MGKFKNDLEMFNFMRDFFYSAVLSDVLDEAGFMDCAIKPSSSIRPLYPEAIIAGRARTLLNAPGETEKSNPYRLAIELMDSLKPGDVAIAVASEPLDTGIMGELSATAMRARGAMGALVDGYTRDARKLIQMQYPVFARGNSPIDTTGRARVVDYDCTVTFGGRQVGPGQIVFADLDGIVIIPKEAEEEIISEATKRVQQETKVRMELNKGTKISEVWEKYRVM